MKLRTKSTCALVFDDIMCKYKPEIRFSLVTLDYTARGNYPFRKAYAEPQTKTPLGPWGFKYRTVTNIDLLEEVGCKAVARAAVEIIVNDFKGGRNKTDNIPYKPSIELCNVVPGDDFSALASEANFRVMNEAQLISSTYQPSRVILQREHRLLFHDVMTDVKQRMLIALAKILNSVADGPPLEILCDDDLYEEGEEGWAEPGDKCWWMALEEALAEGPIFEESDEACACTNPGGDNGAHAPPDGDEPQQLQAKAAAVKLNQINQHLFGFFNCVLNLTRSGVLHTRTHAVQKSIKSVLSVADRVYRLLGPKLPTYQKGPLYIRDPDRFFVEHLEVFVGILGTALVLSTSAFPCAAQDLVLATDHKIIITNLKFAGVFRQTLERMLESPPKTLISKQLLLQKYRHPANEVMLYPIMQSLIDFKNLVEAYCQESVPIFVEEDLEEIEELLIFFQLTLAVLSREIVACWIYDGLPTRYQTLLDDFPHLIAYDPEGDPREKQLPPPELKRNRADAPRRLREFVSFTEDESAFVAPLAKMAGRLERSSGASRDVVDLRDDESSDIFGGQQQQDKMSKPVETAAEIFATLPGFNQLAEQLGVDLEKPKLQERDETYEWEINADCGSYAPKGDDDPKQWSEQQKQQQRVASQLLTEPVQAVGATIDVLKTFPASMLNKASAAVDRFPANTPGAFNTRHADLGEAFMTRKTVLDTRMNRRMAPKRTQGNSACKIMAELFADAPLATCESDIEDWSDFGEFQNSNVPDEADLLNGNATPLRNHKSDKIQPRGRKINEPDNFTESFSASLEDLVNTFDEKVTKCFFNFEENVEKFAPVQVRSQDEVMNDCQMWWTITGNYGNILPIDWSKSVARDMHMPALNVGTRDDNDNLEAMRSGLRRKGSGNGNRDEDFSSEDEAVASDLDMHALILSGLPSANQEPIKGADEVLKEIDDMMENGVSDESGVDSESRGSEVGDVFSSPVVHHLRKDKLEMLTQRELNDLYTEIEMEIRELSESLIAELALRDELEYEKELKNQFIALMVSIQNKKRHLSTSSHHRRTQKGVDKTTETKTTALSAKFRGTNDPKYLTTIIPYHTGSGPPDSNSLQILIKILRAIDEDSPAVPALLTDYILKDPFFVGDVIVEEASSGVGKVAGRTSESEEALRKIYQWNTFARQWWLYDAKWQDPFYSALTIAKYLAGRHKPIFSPVSDCGDHVVVINTKDIAMPAEDWRFRVYFHHTGYPGGATWTPAYDLHKKDPTMVLHKAVYRSLGNNLWRRTKMERLHLFSDDEVPADVMQNVSNQIRQLRKVPKKIGEYNEEELDEFPKLFDLPKDYCPE
ncbi:unnamed protein product [Notodromas monacha]|uniref:Uncharacterized protein n=1 Tax=Notodromas monacha TaxID=399045 RepID=A0A7R9GAG9_9CRUS|nr:unnamed protein product [Notodromas monacha]CAG0913970.1 unnamed protein product [Notodromas monacha]